MGPRGFWQVDHLGGMVLFHAMLCSRCSPGIGSLLSQVCNSKTVTSQSAVIAVIIQGLAAHLLSAGRKRKRKAIMQEHSHKRITLPNVEEKDTTNFEQPPKKGGNFSSILSTPVIMSPPKRRDP